MRKYYKRILIILYLIATFLICAHLDAQVTFTEPVAQYIK